MRVKRGEEAAMLLAAYQQAAQQDATATIQRRRTIRNLFVVMSAIAFFVGCIAVLDMFAKSGEEADAITMKATRPDTDDEAIAMESQFGWNSISNGWCSVKKTTWCMFSKDKDKCKESLKCSKDERHDDTGYTGSGSGSGSGSGGYGNITVGEE